MNTVNPVARTRTVRRMGTVSLLSFVVLIAFLVRLVDIQVVRAAELSAESTQLRVATATVFASRGSILDRNGQILAENADRYDVTASPRHVSDFRRDGEIVTAQEAVAEIAAITGESAEVMWAQLTADPESNFTYLSKEADVEQYRALVALDVPWMYFERNPDRYYPFGSVAGNLTGIVGADGPLEGIELGADECLAAQHGEVTYQRGEDGVVLPGTSEIAVEPIDGGDVSLTIDSDLQWFVLQQIAQTGANLGASSGSAMVVEVATGQIIAAADWPTYDPNDFSQTPQANLRASNFSAAYEPGSTIKTMTIAALLDRGLTTADEAFSVPATVTLAGDHFVKNSSGGGAGNLTTAGILSDSSNTGVVKLSERLSAKELHDYFEKFGFGQPTAVGFLGEQAGYLQDPDTIDPVSRYTQSFGQGISSTFAQMAGAYQAIANGGVRLPLKLFSGCTRADGEFEEAASPAPVRVVSERAASETIRMLETVPISGTLEGRVSVPGYRIAAKTGTAEIAENRRYGYERMISIAGMIPAEDPQYVVVVGFVKPQANRFSYAAAPAFDAIVTHLVKHFRIAPSTEEANLPPVTW